MMTCLRPANVDPAARALEELQRVKRVIGAIQTRWAEVKILVRDDSIYSHEDIMA